MNSQTAWEKAASADGTTPSERALASLARKAFLSLWSYPNVFTDEGRANGKGDGKELCDLLVVFGNDVLLFSDKDCAFRSDIDVSVAWPRWYRSAIDVGADPNLSHRADPILSQGRRPAFWSLAVDKFRSWPGSLTSSMVF